jgi:hypothetical protein
MAANPLIVVQNAIYGAQPTALDITQATQTLLDNQYTANPAITVFNIQISPVGLGIPDPAPGAVKSFTITYSIIGSTNVRSLSRGGQDGQTLNITALPLNNLQVLRAAYGTGTMGINLTQRLKDYFADPGNSAYITIGSQNFFNAFTNGSDPAPGTSKYFSVAYQTTEGGTVINWCGSDGQTLAMWANGCSRPSFLPLNTPLNVGDTLVSNNRKFYTVMQSDGNLCVYAGDPDHQGAYQWGSQATGSGGQFFTIVQGDGNLCTYYGSLSQQGAYLWGSQATADGGQFFLIMQDDGNLCVYKGTGPNDWGAWVWGSKNT